MEKIKETFVDKLDSFRRDHLVPAKDDRKKFEKTTKQYCTAMEKHLALKPAKSAEGQVQESDASIESEKRVFRREAMAYVMKLQEVQERRKFEFVEILLAFMYGGKTFYHQGHETGEEMSPYMTDLGINLNKTRDNFDSTRTEATLLMHKMLEKPAQESSTGNKMFTRQGYLFSMEKSKLLFLTRELTCITCKVGGCALAPSPAVHAVLNMTVYTCACRGSWYSLEQVFLFVSEGS